MSLIKDGKVYRTIEEQVAWLTKTKNDSYKKEEVDGMVETLNQEIDTKADKQEFNSTVETLNQKINTKVDKQEFNSTVETLNQKINTKQDKLTFDTSPTENSSNPVTSGGIYNAIQLEKQEVNSSISNLEQQIETKQDKQEFNSTVSDLQQQINTKQDRQEFLSTVASLEQQINTKQNELVFDTTPTVNSTNPVTSGGVYNAIETEKQEVNQTVETLNQKINTKQDKLNFDSTPTQNSSNPVTSGGVYNALSQKTTTRVNGVISDLEFNSNPQTQIGNLTELATTNKNSLVSAINEVKNSPAGGLEEVVLFDRVNNNGGGINLSSKNYINLADYGLVGDLKDYKYINFVVANGNGATEFQISHLARIDQAFLSGNMGSSSTEYPIAVPYYYPLSSTSGFVVGEHTILINKLNKIKLKESRYLQGNSSNLTTNQSTSSILIFKISLLK